MAMDLPKLRKLLSLDPTDPLSRFALGKKLFEEGASETEWTEAAEHLTFANTHAPEHLATYHFLAQTLIRLGRKDEARAVLEEGIRRSSHIAHGMGRDLAPAMSALLETL
jgi:predicted Zn-dependent protease